MEFIAITDIYYIITNVIMFDLIRFFYCNIPIREIRKLTSIIILQYKTNKY